MRGSDYAELAAFVVVARERSFRRAAARLGLSPSGLSHTIRELEEGLGTRLLNRTTRSVAPTDAGQALYSRLAPAFEDILSAVNAARSTRDRPSGTVRLNLPLQAAEIALAGEFGRFAQAYPEVHLELVVEDGLTDVVAAGFDAGIRPGHMLARDMVAVRVTRDLRLAVVSSPEYFARRPPPQTPRDLKDHACINYRFTTSGALYRWSFARGAETLEVAVEGSLTLNDTRLIRAAALAGAGLACILQDSVAEDIAAGKLVRVLEDWCPPYVGFYLYHPGRRQMPAGLRALIDFLRVDGP
jgi:DNA-binding transcriptional LysR family regulator